MTGEPTGKPPPTALNLSWRHVAVASLAVAAFAGILTALSDYSWQRLAVADGASVLAGLTATWMASRRARSGPDVRPWRLLTIGLALFTAGEVYWFVVEVVLGQGVDLLSMADLAYYAGYGFFVAALFSWFPRPVPHERLMARAAEVILLATALMLLLWVLFLGDVLASVTTVSLALVVGSGYAPTDALLAAVFIALASELRSSRLLSPALVGAGFLMWGLADALYGYVAVGAVAIPSLVLDIGWFGGYVAIILGALATREDQGAPWRRNIGRILTPHPAITDAVPQRRARLTAAIAIISLIATVAALAVIAAVRPTLVATATSTLWIMAALAIGFGTLYFLARTRYAQEAAYFLVLAEEVALATTMILAADGTTATVVGYALLMPALLATLLVSPLAGVALAWGNAAFVLVAGLGDSAPLEAVATAGFLFTFGSILGLAGFAWERDFGGLASAVGGERRAHDALLRSEARLNGILEGQAALIVRVDTSNRITYMNGAYRRAFGLRVGDTFWVKVHPDDEAKTKQAMARLQQPPYSCSVEQRCEIAGEWRNIFWQDSVVRDASGAIVEIQGVGFDVTERRRAEEALELRERLLLETQALAHVGSWEVDVATDALTGSPENARLYQLEGEPSLTSASLRRHIHPEDTPRVEAAFAAAIATGRASVEHRIVPADGSLRWLSVTMECRYGRDGRPARLVGIAQDVTAARRALQEARTAERLREEAAFKTQFLNNAAHELATPLTPLKIQVANLLARDDVDPKDRNAYAMLDRNVRRLSVLVGDLLDAARLQSSRLRLRLGPADLAELARHVVASFGEQAATTHVSFVVEAPRAAPLVCDATRVEQVLFNLASNALKFTPAGGRVTFLVRIEGSDVVAVVRDTGIGMTPEAMARLFAPFTQVHDTQQVPVGGTGLGLYISRGIAQQHGGSLTVESEGAGLGAAFTLRLPAVPPKQADADGHA